MIRNEIKLVAPPAARKLFLGHLLASHRRWSPQGKNLSWHTIVNAVLPALEGEEKELPHRSSVGTALHRPHSAPEAAASRTATEPQARAGGTRRHRRFRLILLLLCRTLLPS